ncbi:MAG TPA: M1 family metallopeptidase, partial [Bacteroidales bacterium]|nr:M1 family metallopeptidase [Bacteroidales bacterium]
MKLTLRLQLLFITIFSVTSTYTYAQSSGGVLSPQQAAYDVNYYDLDLNIDNIALTISGSLICRVEIVNQLDTLVLDLDNRFNVDSTLFKLGNGNYSNVAFDHTNGKLNIEFPFSVGSGNMISVQVFYNGAPRIAPNPPWNGGFVWNSSPIGDPWIGVACEFEGADLWWPCKDHPSDEPDSMSMSFTVPNPLICVSNGRYMGSTVNGNNTTTFDWFISTPINNYNVTIYAAEFALIEDTYIGMTGDSIPFYFWVLPEDSATAANWMGVFLTEFNFLESICGPFPFTTDKHGWAHAPYWGMEHQTIIAYGHNFSVNSWGFDYIHYHELAHEWWGNLITAKDFADIWIHEGMATYTEALYVEFLSGMDSYHQYMDNMRPNNNHSSPLAPREQLTASQGFALNPYSRGASVMHTLRYHLGDDEFFNLFERWAYPDSTDFDNTNGRQCRILSTEDMKEQAEEVTGLDLYPFWEVFFREAAYPVLHVVREINEATFTWETENNILLDVDIPITVNGLDETVVMIEGQGSSAISIDDIMEIDPKKWILMAPPSIVVSI